MKYIEETLTADEARLAVLLKQCGQLGTTLKAWKRATSEGNVPDRKKQADRASAVASELAPAINAAAASWDFDVGEYLSSNTWREELLQAASRSGSVKLLEVAGELVSSPVALRSEPGKSCLRIGKTRWSKLRPMAVISELVRLREQGAIQRPQEFLDHLCLATEFLNRSSTSQRSFAKLRDVFELFAMTPGWKRDNSEAAFGQYLYSLHKSDVRVTRSGMAFEWEWPTGSPKAKDIFEVVADDGRTVRYYAIHFR